MRGLMFAVGLIATCVCWSASAADSVKAAAKGEKPNEEWNQWGGSNQRNNTPVGQNIPSEWEVGNIDFRTGAWDPKSGKNIKLVARLGSQSVDRLPGDGDRQPRDLSVRRVLAGRHDRAG